MIVALIALVAVQTGASQGAVLDTDDEYWIYFEGPEADENEAMNYPNVLEGRTEHPNACYFNNTVYREGTVKDIGEKIVTSSGDAVSFEEGGWHPDKEICLNIEGKGDDLDSGEKRRSDNYRGGDKGGEWWDLDQWAVTKYLRNNGDSVYANQWKNYWVQQPDSASTTLSTGIIEGNGIALEDDCSTFLGCEDVRGRTGSLDPYAANFTEGSLDDDNNFDTNTPFTVRGLNNFHNRVQSGNATGHPGPINGAPQQGGGNTQDMETNLDLRSDPLQNSHIDAEDDEWALSPTLGYAIANDGTPFPPGRCYGAERVQGIDKNKRQAIYANSFANVSHVYDGELSGTDRFRNLGLANPEDYSADGNWINPDNDYRSADLGSFSCDLTGKDWGFGFSESSIDELKCRAPDQLNTDDCEKEGDPHNRYRNGFNPDQPHSVIAPAGDLQFDMNNDPSRNFQQGVAVVDTQGYLDYVGSFGNNLNLNLYKPDDQKNLEAKEAGAVADLRPTNGLEIAFLDVENNIRFVDTEANSTDTGVQGKDVGGAGDFDGDGILEVGYISQSDDSINFVDYKGKVTSTSVKADIMGGVGDIDGDGDPEVAFRELDSGTLAYTGSSGNVGSGTGVQVYDVGGVGELDDDGRQEIAYENQYHSVTFVDSEYNYGSTPVESMDVGGVGDADNDGKLEISYIEAEYDDQDFSSNFKLKFIDEDGEVMDSGVTKQKIGGFGSVQHPGFRTLKQYPNACGDDQNEYLIREHAATYGGESNPNLEGRSDYYACADRPTDCVFDGEVYSQGELVDVQGEGGRETGVNSIDQEICVDFDPEIPGGEWVDPDNESVRELLIGDGSPDNPEYYIRESEPSEGKPGRVVWHDGDDTSAAREARISPYNPADYETGYALEDDCDPALRDSVNSGCDDSGLDEQLIQGNFIYSPFEAGMYADDANVFGEIAVRTYIGDGTGEGASAAHGASNGQDEENTEGVVFDSSDNWPTDNLNDSSIDRLEDTWAISNYSYHPVGPTGKVWTNGSCYGSSPVNAGNSQGEYVITKDEKVMGNSFAKAVDFDGDGTQEGVWVDPDTTNKTTLTGKVSCDINGNDWGIGFNSGTEMLTIKDNNTEVRYEAEDLHAATGNITFDMNSDPNGIGEDRNLQQYPDACGDDQNEYLIREHMDSRDDTEQEPNLGRQNIYACADRISDCAFHGEVYSEGQLVDVQSYGREERGSNSVDEEVCVDVDETVPGGEWIDVDNESINQLLKGEEDDGESYTEDDPNTYKGLVRANSSYDGNGVKWFTDSYGPAAEVEMSPYNPLDYSDGYALEDDCGPDVEFCEDSGLENTHMEGKAVYSYFEEGHVEDDRISSLVDDGAGDKVVAGEVFTGVSVRTWVGYANGTASYEHGATNSQDEENTEGVIFDSSESWPTENLNDSTIDPKEDTWAIANSTEKAVDPTGRPLSPGKCYGRSVLDTEDYQVTKNEKVVGNSFAMAVDVNHDGTSRKKGVWVNPDSTLQSALSGNLSCEINSTDWGYGYNIGEGEELQVIRGDAREFGYDRSDPHVVAGDIKFDMNSDPNGIGEDRNLQQYPNACGDDANEYLIREHIDTSDNTEQRPDLSEDDIYACADRISDCAFQGEVYSEGQVVDIQSNSREEQGTNSIDEEVCVDVDETVPGGEWYDVDNESLNQYLKGAEGLYTEDNPNTYSGLVRKNSSYDGDGVKWFTDSYGPAAEVEKSPFNPLNYSDGYALEDDCGPGINYCEDSGVEDTQFEPDAVYSYFEEGHIGDDRKPSPEDDTRPDPDSDYFEAISVRMYVGFANGTASAEHGATNSQDQENVPDDLNFNVTKWGKTVSLNDSTIDPLEDTWALANRTSAIVGPTGKVYRERKCYGQSVLDQEDYQSTKAQKAVGNSYAMSVDVNGDGTEDEKGVWVNPDSTNKSAISGMLSCELNATDWGYGYDTGDGDELQIIRGDAREREYDRTDPHVVAGDIQFDIESDPGAAEQDHLQQYPSACGDDRNEYLVREHHSPVEGLEHNPSLERDDIYGCTDRISDCVFQGEVYSEGQLVDVSDQSRERGVNSVDEEVCVDVDESIPGGEWYDVDNESINRLLKGENYEEDTTDSYENPFVRTTANYDGDGVVWHNSSFAPAEEAEISPYNNITYSDGYALEDDCAANVEYCSDEGATEQHFTPDAVYSYFEEGRPEDDANVFEGRSVRMYVGYANGTASYEHGSTNSQDEENAYGLEFDSTEYGWSTEGLNDSTIDPLEDTWAISAKLEWPVGPTGQVWQNGSCYGRNPWIYPDSDWVTKDQKVVANSFAMAVDVNGYPPQSEHYDTSSVEGQKKGIWANPDSTVDSAVTGGTSCDLNATDWGYGYNIGEGETLREISGEGIREQGYDTSDPHVVAGDIQFDINSDPNGVGASENLPQYPGACGDDQNEFLIREHRSLTDSSEHNPQLEDEDIYVCADRLSDCAYNGSVYSMGQKVDISSGSDDEELGVGSADAEICVDTNPEIPGGEWQDADNETNREHVIGDGDPKDVETYDGFISYRNGSGNVHWFNSTWGEDVDYPAREANISPYNPVDYSTGYALEDDCGPEVSYCEDTGITQTFMNNDSDPSDDLVYSPFVAGEGADDYDVFDGTVVRMYVGGSAEHGASNDQEEENVFENLPSLNDSTIDRNEDTWAIAGEPYYAVGPMGHVYKNGSCYGRFNSDTKAGTVVANSFAYAHDVDGDGEKEGDWVNPDNYEDAILKGHGTCNLYKASGWGMGYNNESRDELRVIQGDAREQGFNDTEDWQYHVVSGPITFDAEKDPGTMDQDNLPQYPNACGDDQNEILVREHMSNATKDEARPSLERENIYACADRVSDCVYNGSVYSEGQTVDISSIGNDDESGLNSTDTEVCINTDDRIPGGEWHDIDNVEWRNYLTGANDTDWDYEEDNISTYKRLVEPETGDHWFTDNHSAALEVEISPFNPLNFSDGYALEDDCDPDLAYCADIGEENQYMPGYAVYSAFEEDIGEDDSNVFEGRAVNMYVGYANGTAWSYHGATNNQSEENTEALNFNVTKWGKTISLNDSTIDRREDTWAIADNTSDVVGPTGKLYDPGKCYGNDPSTNEEDWIQKNETVVANSFAYAQEVNDDGNDEGVWVNPDSTEKSLTQGNFSCELNTTDWGIGYDKGEDSALEAHYGEPRSSGYEASDIHAVSGPIQFDIESDPGKKEQRDQMQYPRACGDDQNEYLVREHGSNVANEFRPNLSRDNIYGCTDRISDCVYNGEVYSEGQTVDVSDAAAPNENPERGDDIADEEICLDLDKTVPGGEFYDKDNNWTVESKIKEIADQPEKTWERIEYFEDHDFGVNPGTDWKNRTHKLNRTEFGYFNNSGFTEADYESYRPSGYATEDDCGTIMQRPSTGPCGDVGADTQNISWMNAGNFSFVPNNPNMQEGAPQDNYDDFYGFTGFHNKIDDSSDQFEPGAATQRNWNLSDVYGEDYKVYDSRDSTSGPDKWALTRFMNYSVDNRGNGYPPATEDRSGCFYRPEIDERTGVDDQGVDKKYKIFGNSLAVAKDFDNDGLDEGVWEDPDDVGVQYANFSCDITGPDKGYGFDTGDKEGEFTYKNDDKSTHVVTGDIAFAVKDGKTGAFDQEPPVCGDDHKEYLLEELGATQNSLEGTGQFGCGTDRNDCVARSGGEYALYREGDTVNTDEASENFGRSKDDAEVCMQRTQDTYGVWYDQDYGPELCQVNNLYGSAGVRWISPDFIDRHPYSVVEGIDDDMNPYLEKRLGDVNRSTQGNVTEYLEDTENRTPVPTGRYVNKSVDQYYSEYSSWEPDDEYLNYSATKGFCGGDDEGENIAVQQASTELIQTNYSVIGIADDPDDCVIDGGNYESISHEKRKLYSPGDEVSLDLGQSQRTISCYSGQWFANWPVTFLQENVSVEATTEREITFKVINVRNTETSYEVSLNTDEEIEAFTQFTDYDGDTFKTTVPAESSRRYSIQVYGQDQEVGPANITVRARSITGDIQGSDEVTVDVVGELESTQGTSQTPSEVPGIMPIQLIALLMLSTLIYYRRM